MHVPGRQEAEQLATRGKRVGGWGRRVGEADLTEPCDPVGHLDFVLRAPAAIRGFKTGRMIWFASKTNWLLWGEWTIRGSWKMQGDQEDHPILDFPFPLVLMGTVEPTFAELACNNTHRAWGLRSKNSRIIFIFSLPKEQRPREGLWCCHSGVICFYF